MDIAFNPAARWNELTAWITGRSAVATQRPAKCREGSRRQPALERDITAGATLRVARPLGTEIVCLNGTLWITHDGEEHDHIVVAGKPYVARHGGTMLVHAMSAARCLLIGPQP